MPKIYCFGNEFIPDDDIAVLLANKIKRINHFEFIKAESPMEILAEKEELWILDVVKGVSKTKIIDNPQQLKLTHSLTCHDLDVGFYLKLLLETGKLKMVRIIALPYGEKNINALEKEIVKILKKK